MCEISKSQRRTYRDQDPPRILEMTTATTTTTTMMMAAAAADESTEFFIRKPARREEEASITAEVASAVRVESSAVSSGRDELNTLACRVVETEENNVNKVPSSSSSSSSSTYSTLTSGTIISSCKEVTINGIKRDPDSCESLTNDKEMAPVMGVPPPPPPAPHMGPDGLILPRKPYNPCLISSNHKDLRRELLFNQKIGKSVLNQKSELQRALERQREAAVRREAQKNHEESYRDDPRTALQRALEQRARQIELMEQPPVVEPPNPLVTARAKLRTRTDSQ